MRWRGWNRWRVMVFGSLISIAYLRSGQAQPANGAYEWTLHAADAAYKEKRFDDALRLYESAANLDPSKAKPYFMRAELFRRKGDKVRALEFYERYLSIKPDGQVAAEAKAALQELRAALDKEEHKVLQPADADPRRKVKPEQSPKTALRSPSPVAVPLTDARQSLSRPTSTDGAPAGASTGVPVDRKPASDGHAARTGLVGIGGAVVAGGVFYPGQHQEVLVQTAMVGGRVAVDVRLWGNDRFYLRMGGAYEGLKAIGSSSNNDLHNFDVDGVLGTNINRVFSLAVAVGVGATTVTNRDVPQGVQPITNSGFRCAVGFEMAVRPIRDFERLQFVIAGFRAGYSPKILNGVNIVLDGKVVADSTSRVDLLGEAGLRILLP